MLKSTRAHTYVDPLRSNYDPRVGSAIYRERRMAGHEKKMRI